MSQTDENNSYAHDPILHPEEVGTPPPGRPWAKWAVYILGMGMLAGVVWYAIGDTDWSNLKHADPRDAAGMLLLVVVSLVINAMMFSLLTKPFEAEGKPVSLVDWTALMCATSLLNYLPARVGLFGRIAYLKKQHDITIRAHGMTLFAAAVGTCGVYLLMTLLTVWRKQFDAIWWGGLAGGLLAGAAVSTPLMAMGIKRFGTRAPRSDLFLWIVVWYLLRFVDTLSFVGRFYLAARVIGEPMELDQALLVGVAANFAVLATPFPGGLGIREAVGGYLAQSAGLMIVDRAAEAAVFITTGLISIWYLHRRVHRNGAAPAESPITKTQ